MMSQNSHENGQPREYCNDMQLYFLRFAMPKSGTGANDMGGRSGAL